MEQQTANFIDENFTSIKLFLKSYGIHSNTKKWLSLIENITNLPIKSVPFKHH